LKAIDALSFQLYSARFLQPLDRQIELLAGLGYRHVEPFGGLFTDVPKLRELLHAHGLTAPSAHVGLDRLRADPVAAAKLCRDLTLQLRFLKISESMGNDDSKVVDADSVD